MPVMFLLAFIAWSA